MRARKSAPKAAMRRKKVPLGAAKKTLEMAHDLRGGRETVIQSLTLVIARDHPRWSPERQRAEVRKQYRQIYKHYATGEFGKES